MVCECEGGCQEARSIPLMWAPAQKPILPRKIPSRSKTRHQWKACVTFPSREVRGCEAGVWWRQGAELVGRKKDWKWGAEGSRRRGREGASREYP